MHNKHQWLFPVYTFLVLICTGLLLFLLTKGCGLQPKTKTVVERQPERPAPTCDGLRLGETKAVECEEGEIGEVILVCTADTGLVEASNTCQSPEPGCGDVVNFADDIQPILTASCVSCHFTPEKIDDYEVAKRKIREIVETVNLAEDNPRRMPKAPRDPLPLRERQFLEEWRDTGFSVDGECPTTDPGNDQARILMDIDYIEETILDDLSRLDEDDRKFTRYLVASHRYNLGDDSAVDYLKAAEKGLNSLDTFGRDLARVRSVDSRETIFRFDLRSYSQDAIRWAKIEDFDPLDLESFTDRGQLLKLLAGTRKPWMHIDLFLEISQRSPLYYVLTDTPATFNGLMQKLGVNFEQDVANFDALFAGFNGSPISLQKNRLISRHEGLDGYIWVTFDPIDLDGVPERNLFEFPLLEEAGGVANFNFDASEVIYRMPNGMQGYALYNADGVIEDEAPLTVVTCAEGFGCIDPVIENAVDCHRCHEHGLIFAEDQVRDHIEAHASEFLRDDVERVRELFRGGEAAAITSDNAEYQASLERINITVAEPDPINSAIDRLLLEWTLEDVAAFLLLSVEDFSLCLQQSSAGRAQIGQLINGAEITFNQFVETIGVLKEDCRLYQESL